LDKAYSIAWETRSLEETADDDEEVVDVDEDSALGKVARSEAKVVLNFANPTKAIEVPRKTRLAKNEEAREDLVKVLPARKQS
jgi:hypothetical protein